MFIGAALGLVVMGGACGSAAASRLPDLRPRAPAVSRPPDAGLDILTRVGNRGQAAAGRFQVALLLSRSRRHAAGDVRLAVVAFRGLAAGATVTLHRRRRIPSGLAAGTYWVLVCVDPRHRVRESSERNNCTPSASSVRIAAPAPAPGGGAAAPSFAGLTAATTCVSGPRSGTGAPSSYELRWDAATDDRSAPSAIVYDVYAADHAGGEDFSSPLGTTAGGASAFSTPLLTNAHPWFFVVRARDEAGNREANTVERTGVNVCT